MSPWYMWTWRIDTCGYHSFIHVDMTDRYMWTWLIQVCDINLWHTRTPEIVREFKDLALFLVFLATFGSVMYFQNRLREVLLCLQILNSKYFLDSLLFDFAHARSTLQITEGNGAKCLDARYLDVGMFKFALFLVFLATFGSVMYFQNRPREVLLCLQILNSKYFLDSLLFDFTRTLHSSNHGG